MSSTRVLRRYESHASYQVLASRIPRGADSCRVPVGLRRFRRFPTIEHDARSGRSLGLAGVQHKAPAAHAFVIHHLRITENTGSRGWREPGGLSVVKQERNVLKGCLSHVRGLMGSRPLLRIGGEIGLPALGTRGVRFSPGSWFAISASSMFTDTLSVV